MLKGALVYSDIISTVSNTYAGEIKTAEYGEYLDPVIRYHHMKLCGIVNGIDYDIWNPATDEKIAQKFDVNSVIEGKKANKRALQEELGLEVDDGKFMIALISRLTDQKGLDLIAPIFEQFIDGNTQFVLIGTGEPQYEDMFRYFENAHKGTVSSNIMYSDERAHKVYAAGVRTPTTGSDGSPCFVTTSMASRLPCLSRCLNCSTACSVSTPSAMNSKESLTWSRMSR